MIARPYQQRIINNTVDLFTNENLGRIMIESPTGSGKTFMGLNIGQEMSNQIPNLKIIWIAMRRFLLSQVRDEIAKFGINAEIIPMSMFDFEQAKQIRQGHGEEPLMIVLDEAHHDAAGSMTDLYQILEPDYILGLSATPYRVDKAALCFEKQIRDAGIHRLIQDGYLSKFNAYSIEDWNPETIIKHFMANPAKWGKSVFYFLTIKEAEEMHRLLIANGIPTHLVLGSDNEKTRVDQLKDFRQGTVQCLVNCMVLTEGFDCPELETVWVRPSSKGPTMQMAGRVFRIHPGITKRVVQSKDTKWPISRTASPERQFIWCEKTNKWLDAKPNKKLMEISIEAIKSTIDNYKPLPEFITKNKKLKKQKD